jgi:triosephosphate isomerase
VSDRVPVIAANWKMNKTLEEARDFCDRFLPQVEGSTAEIVLCPPYFALPLVAEATKTGSVEVAAQNMHYEPDGAYTGEVSAAMLLDAGARAVVLGHSERRQLFGETDEERSRDETDRILRRQIDAGLSRVPAERLAEVVVAYEPIWAIGTGKTATPEQAEDACGFVRSLVLTRDASAAERIRILYGGSVKPGNAAELLGREEIDGALVGGASLDPDDFAAIVAAAG